MVKNIIRTVELLENFNIDEKRLYIKILPFIQEAIVEQLRPTEEELIIWKTSSTGRFQFREYINNHSKKRLPEKHVDALWNYYTGNVNIQRSKMLLERFKILNKDNQNCAYCSEKENLQIDHKIPLVKGGLDELENLQYLCAKCNYAKRGSYDFIDLIC